MITKSELEHIVYRYWANRFNCQQKDFSNPGSLVIREEEFSETDRILVYNIDKMSVIRIAPILADRANLPNGYSMDIGVISAHQIQKWLDKKYTFATDGPFLDCYLYPDDFKPITAPSHFEAKRLSPEKDNPILLDFYAECSEEDIDEAEIFVDKPDPIIYGLFDGKKMAAYASHRYWDDVIADIGVLVHSNYRSLGLGKAVVSSLCQWCIENDIVPMYRVFRKHVHSWRIQAALGFTEMVRIDTLKLVA